MALANRGDVEAAAANWLNRTDLTDRIPEFLLLAEARIKRDVRRRSVAATIAVAASPVTLPAACDELRSIRLNTGNPHMDLPIGIGTFEMLAEVRANTAAVAGRPTQAAVLNDKLYFAPEPAASYDAFVTYFEKVDALSGATATNTLLTEAPDLYLFGILSEAAPYLQHDERVPLWETKYLTAVEGLNAKRSREEFNASLRPARLPRVFG